MVKTAPIETGTREVMQKRKTIQSNRSWRWKSMDRWKVALCDIEKFECLHHQVDKNGGLLEDNNADDMNISRIKNLIIRQFMVVEGLQMLWTCMTMTSLKGYVGPTSYDYAKKDDQVLV